MEPIFTDKQLNNMSREDLISLMKIVQEQTKSFLDALFDVAVNDGKRFPAAGKSDNRRSPERVNHIRPTRIPPFIIIEKRRKIDGVFII